MEKKFNKDEILLKNEKKCFESSFINMSWITIYHATEHGCIYSYLVTDSCIQNELIIKQPLGIMPKWAKTNNSSNFEWTIGPGNEGRPSVWGDGRYERFADKGIEPLIFLKSFNIEGAVEKYIDISEEFVLYFELYEKGKSKQNRTFYHIGDLGELEEVIKIEPQKVTVNLKYLNDYLAIRKMNFVSCCDFSKHAKLRLEDYGMKPEDIYKKSELSIFHFNLKNENGNALSRIEGKRIMKYDLSVLSKNKKKAYTEYIVGNDGVGNEIMHSCEPTESNILRYAWFDKKVLDKYYFNPTIYTIDSFSVRSHYFTLKFDNNLEKYIAVNISDLGRIPYKEQLYWKLYNVEAQFQLSNTYINTMLDGNRFNQPEVPDLFFKHKYEEFNESWKKKFGWRLFKPLATQQQYRYNSLHIPVSNNIKSFCDEILTINILLIDRLNEEELWKCVQKKDSKKNDTNIKTYKASIIDRVGAIPDDVEIRKKPQPRGINKLASFLNFYNAQNEDVISFLKQLYDLRSGLLAHSFSETDKKCQEAMTYFAFENKNYQEIAIDIFERATAMLNSLEKSLLLEKNKGAI